MTPDIERLIERLEKATGPDRQLDGAIKAAACPPPSLDGAPANVFIRMSNDTEGVFKTNPTIELSYRSRVPEYTTSLDAALTLVPEGLVICSTLCSDGNLQIIEAWFHRKDDEAVNGLEIVENRGDDITARPAIAVCQVALKAHAALARLHGGAA